MSGHHDPCVGEAQLRGDAYLPGVADESQLELLVTNLEQLAADRSQHGQFDQVLLLDVIEHILDAPAALRQIHALTAEDGLVYITTPDRDWQGNADRLRVTRKEDGWHVRNGYTMEQLEALLEQAGFEPVDRLRYGTKGSTLVTWIQHHLFRSWIDPLTVLFFPVLKLAALGSLPGAIRIQSSCWRGSVAPADRNVARRRGTRIRWRVVDREGRNSLQPR